ncbi:hypothetical protein RFI_13045, partial [Reticulomyxa filosa]
MLCTWLQLDRIEWEDKANGIKYNEELDIKDIRVELRGDRLVVFTETLSIPPNARVSVSLSDDVVHSHPKQEDNGNVMMSNLVTYTTAANSGIPWKKISEEYLFHAFHLSNFKAWFVHLLIATLHLDDDRNAWDGTLKRLRPLWGYLDIENDRRARGNKQAAGRSVQKDDFVYLQGTRYLLEAYNYLFVDANTAMQYLDKALLLHSQDRDVAWLERAGEMYCPFPFFDTYYRLPFGYFGNRLPDHFVRHYFPKAVRLQLFSREY